MDESPILHNPTAKHLKITALVILLFAIGFFVGWLFGHNSSFTKSNNIASSNDSQSTSTSNASSAMVKDLVSYTLPDAWSENVCSASSIALFFIPNGTALNCNANPIAPIKSYVDTQNSTDCQQLNTANTQNIIKHVCISLYINGHKSLKASTEYSSDSAYKINTTISGYYINTGKGVVAIEYTYTSANDFQLGFDQLANSIKVKD